MVSTLNKIRKLEGCLGTNDMSAWEETFVRALRAKVREGDGTQLTDAQIDKLQELYDKHFA
jgi:hypothetical protein